VTDPAIATRHRLLAYEVKKAANCSWDALDAWLLEFPPHETKRPRMMWSMAKYGLQSATARLIKDGFDLIARLTGDDRFASAVGNYRSALWELVTPPAKSVTERQDLFKKLVDERGLFRATDEQQYWGAWLYPGDPAFSVRREDSMLRTSYEMDSTNLLDKIALFACAYMDAMDFLDLTAAKSCIDAIWHLSGSYGEQLSEVTNDINLTFCNLLTARILKQDWSTDVSRFRDHSLRMLSRQHLVDATSVNDSPTRKGMLYPFPLIPPQAPLVFHTERTRWIQKHSTQLQNEISTKDRPPWIQVVFGQSHTAEYHAKRRAHVKNKIATPPK
jgi:hypothetical protein